MSLIDDALRRAREEAARQDEAHRRTKRPWISPEPPRVRGGRAIFIAVVLGIGVGGGAAAWLLLRRPAPRHTLPSPPRASPSRPLATVVVSPPDRRPSPTLTAAKTSPIVSVPPRAPGSPAASPEKEIAASSIPNGKTFVRVASLPGGEKIELEGIVFSETNPVAVIGGKVLAPGAHVGDFELVRIEENRVELHGRGVAIFIALE